MLAILRGNTVIVGKDLADCVCTPPAVGWTFSMMPGVDRNIIVIGERSMDEAEKIVVGVLKSEGMALKGYAAQRF